MWRHSGQNLRILWLVLAVWLLLPCCCSWADVVLSDEEATALKASLQTAKKELTEQQMQIEKLQSTLETQKSDLRSAREELQKSQTETEALKQDLTKLSQSWKEQKKEARWGKAKAFCIGLAFGVAGGLAGGYYLTR